jgi:hypothetical protein
MKIMTYVEEIKNKFNKLSSDLGCRARITGNVKKIEFQEVIGETADGYETVVKITASRFNQLIKKYPQLEEL